MTDTALATRPKTPDVITTREEFSESLAFWREQQFHVLSPFTNVSGLAQQHGIIASLVKIDSDPNGLAGEVYGGLPFLKGKRGDMSEEVALSKIGLRKIAECAGISVTTMRTDPRTIPHYWEFKAIAQYKGIDGGLVTREATAEWDLRDGSERLKGWTSNQTTEGRKNGLRNCETRAINAAIRECGCGIKQKFSRAELQKPFIVLRVMFQPDMSDPLTRRLITEQALRGTSALYPSAALPQHVAEPIDDAEVVTGGDGDEPPATETKATESPYPEGFGLIASITPKTLKRKSDGAEFVKWTVVDHAGVEHVTIRGKLGLALEKHFKEQTPVEIVSDENDRGELEVVEITPWTGESNGALPGMEKL